MTSIPEFGPSTFSSQIGTSIPAQNAPIENAPTYNINDENIPGSPDPHHAIDIPHSTMTDIPLGNPPSSSLLHDGYDDVGGIPPGPQAPKVLKGQFSGKTGDPVPPVVLEWRDLCYSVEVKIKGADRKKHKERRTILHNLNGIVYPGQTLAVMGPSGAGKSTLLSILAGRSKKKDHGTTGEVLVNGETRDKSFRSVTAFVLQDDILMANLTVRETLHYSAMLRLPRSMGKDEKDRRVNNILHELGLTHVADTKIGAPGLIRGISGGERKRVNIGVELITNPRVLFIDEPTSGLDAKTALSIMETILNLAQSGRTVICTIHQPRTGIFDLFDNLLLLADGKTAYLGPAREAVQYFSNVGYPCPGQYNPADYFMDLITETKSDLSEGKRVLQSDKRRIQYLVDKYEESLRVTPTGEGRAVGSLVAPGQGDDIGGYRYDPASVVPLREEHLKSYNSTFIGQTAIVLRRAFTNQLRDRVFTVSRFVQAIALGVLVGLIYLRIDNDQRSVQDRSGVLFFIMINQAFSSLSGVLSTFPAERALFSKERASLSYRVSSYFLGKSFAELPYNILFPVIFGTITYWMVGLHPDFRHYAFFIFVIVLVANVGQSIGLAISAGVPNANIGNIVAPLVLVIMLLFGGFYVNQASLPVFLKWVPYISFIKYGFEALAINEFHGLTFRCPTPPLPCAAPTGDDQLRFLDMDINDKWFDVIMLAVLLVGFRLLAYFFLRFLQKPK